MSNSSRPCAKCGSGDRYPSGACKNCEKRRAKKYKDLHRERLLEARRTKWKNDAGLRKKNAKYNRRAYAENPGRYAAYRKKAKHRVRDWHLKKKYGVGAAWYEATLAAQGGRCAICKSDDPRTPWGKFVIDHCHKTDTVRGILCDWCNKALGLLEDDVVRTSAALAYLERYARTPS